MKWSDVKLSTIERIEAQAEHISNKAYDVSRLAKLVNRRGYVIMRVGRNLASVFDEFKVSYRNLWEVKPFVTEEEARQAFSDAVNGLILDPNLYIVLSVRQAVQQALTVDLAEIAAATARLQGDALFKD